MWRLWATDDTATHAHAELLNPVRRIDGGIVGASFERVVRRLLGQVLIDCHIHWLYLDLIARRVCRWLEAAASLVRGPALQTALEVGKIDLLVDRRYILARCVGNTHRRLPSWRYMQAGTLLLKVIHLTLTCL